MRLVCSGCDCVYGDGINRPKFGFCRECWRLHLLTMELNRRCMYADSERREKRIPLLASLHPMTEPDSGWTPDKVNFAFRDDGEDSTPAPAKEGGG